MSYKKDELIDALERATGPSRWLDAEIAALIHPNQPCEANEDGTIWVPGVGSESGRTLTSRMYTASVDAALTLVPEGYECYVERYKDGSGSANIMRDFDDGGTICVVSVVANPAIAINIAALMARS